MAVTITITIVIGRKKYDCTGFGWCKGSIDISMGERSTLTLDEKCEKMDIEFIERPRKYGDVFFVDEEGNPTRRNPAQQEMQLAAMDGGAADKPTPALAKSQ